MSDDKEATNSAVKYHVMVELFLSLIIVIILIKIFIYIPDIKVDTQGFIKNIVLNFSILPDGTFVVSKQNGEVIDTIPLKNQSSEESLKQLINVGIAVIEKIDTRNYVDRKLGLIDSIISPAMASKHNLPGHKYWNYYWVIGNQTGCTRYDITNYPPNLKNVGACI